MVSKIEKWIQIIENIFTVCFRHVCTMLMFNIFLDTLVRNRAGLLSLSANTHLLLFWVRKR